MNTSINWISEVLNVWNEGDAGQQCSFTPPTPENAELSYSFVQHLTFLPYKKKVHKIKETHRQNILKN